MRDGPFHLPMRQGPWKSLHGDPHIPDPQLLPRRHHLQPKVGDKVAGRLGGAQDWSARLHRDPRSVDQRVVADRLRVGPELGNMGFVRGRARGRIRGPFQRCVLTQRRPERHASVRRDRRRYRSGGLRFPGHQTPLLGPRWSRRGLVQQHWSLPDKPYAGGQERPSGEQAMAGRGTVLTVPSRQETLPRDPPLFRRQEPCRPSTAEDG